MLVDINICRLAAGDDDLALLDDGRNWSSVSRHASDHLNKNLRLESGRYSGTLGFIIKTIKTIQGASVTGERRFVDLKANFGRGESKPVHVTDLRN